MHDFQIFPLISNLYSLGIIFHKENNIAAKHWHLKVSNLKIYIFNANRLNAVNMTQIFKKPN